MTAVATLSILGQTLLVGDTLISRKSQNPSEQLLSTGMLVSVDDQKEWQVVEGGLKIGRINDRIAIGFAGNVSAGNEAMRLLGEIDPSTLPDLEQALLRTVIPSVTPADGGIEVCGFAIQAGEVVKFCCRPEGSRKYAFESSANPEVAYRIGSGGAELMRSVSRDMPAHATADVAIETALAAVDAQLQLRQAAGDREILSRFFGGAIVALLTDGNDIRWQPSRTQIMVQRTGGTGLDTSWSLLPHIQKVQPTSDCVVLHYFASSEGLRGQLGGDRPDVLVTRVLGNALSKAKPTPRELEITFNSETAVIHLLVDGFNESSSITVIQKNAAQLFNEERVEGKLSNVECTISPFLETVFVDEDLKVAANFDGASALLRDLIRRFDQNPERRDDQLMRRIAQQLLNLGIGGDDPQSYAMGLSIYTRVDTGIDDVSPDDIDAFIEKCPPEIKGVSIGAEVRDIIRREAYEVDFRRFWFYRCRRCKSEVFTKRHIENGMESRTWKAGTAFVQHGGFPGKIGLRCPVCKMVSGPFPEQFILGTTFDEFDNRYGGVSEQDPASFRF